MTNKAVFLDRDGTINVDYGYVYREQDLTLITGVADGLRKLQSSGFLLIIITNQSGVGRGYFSKDDVNIFNKKLIDELNNYGVKITDVFICFHSPEDKCTCRKPAPNMILEALKKYNVDPEKSFMIGDKNSDVEAGQASGIKSFLLTDKNNFQSITDEILKTNK